MTIGIGTSRLHLGEGGDVLGEDGFLEPEGAVGLDGLADADRLHRGEAAVHLDEDLDVGADGLADDGDAPDGLFLVLARDEGAPGTGDGVELHGGEAALDDGLGVLGELLVVAGAGPAVGVDADAVAAASAEQLVDRGAGALAGEVPHGLLDAGDGGVVVHGAAAGGEVVVGGVGELLDLRGVPTDHVALELVEVRGDLGVAVGLGVALAPTVETVGGFETDEEEVLASAGVGEDVSEAGDRRRHGSSSVWRTRPYRTASMDGGASAVVWPRSVAGAGSSGRG